ncbi:hypothetical protein DYE50_02700 [Treponema ruminis]|nr:hypothetical protein DYE50_02700 [Treponema ruminis]
MKFTFGITLFCKRTIFLVLPLLLIFLVGCDTVSEDAYVFVKNADFMYVNIDLSERVIIKGDRNPARTIVAPEIDLTNPTYHYYIWGKSSKSTVSPKEVTFESTTATSGTIPLDFPISTYYFTLVATEGVPEDLSDSSKILKKAILVAYTGADLSYSTTVLFHLSTTGLNFYGNMDFSFVLDDTWSNSEIADLNANYNVTVGLFEVDTGEVVSSFPSAMTLAGLNNSSPVSLDTYSAIAGTYNLMVSMKKAGESKTYNYSDTVIVAPNRTITATVAIPNVIEYAPAPPTNFKAAYCIDERIYYDTHTLYDGVASTEAADLAYENEYALLLSWQDNSNNESNFQITLVDVSKMFPMPEVPATMTDSTWANLTSGYLGNKSVTNVYDKNCIYAENYYSGSLDKNSSSLILYVPFDVCYIAKIEAVNAAGISSACYATIDSDFNIEVYDTGYGNNTAVYSGKAFSTAQNPCNMINLYKVVYHFNGGTLEYYKDNALKTVEKSIVEYGVYGTYSFFCPISDLASATESSPALLYLYTGTDAMAPSGSRWQRWKTGSSKGTDLIDTAIGGTSVVVDSTYTYQKPNDYTGYTSLYLFARYD